MIFDHVLDTLGSTPMVRLQAEGLTQINLFAKLEYCNPTGSVKDRAARYILEKLSHQGEINKDTTIIESSSGNFGISLASYCYHNNLKFIGVIDPHISPVNEKIIKSRGATLIKVTEPDVTGGYLLNRITKVKELLDAIPNSYWINQYGNPYNAEAYFHTLGNEICDQVVPLDYVFMGVSSGGTITGVSRKVKERSSHTQVIAVDIVGSVIFGGKPQKRYIPGIGSSMTPEILKYAKIDAVVMMDEITTIKRCHELLERQMILAGGSSGSVFGAVHNYFEGKRFKQKPNVVVIFPDRGERYSDTIYNPEWCRDFCNRFEDYKKISQIV